MKKQFTLLPFFSPAVFLVAIICFSLNVNAQAISQQSTGKTAGKGITFKAPDNFTPIEKWTNFKGVLLLNLKQPAGTFVSYPNEGESIEQLMIRVRSYIVPMFVHEKDVKFDWQTSPLAIHEGDQAARMDVYKNDNQAVQVAFYQREINGRQVVYGYFAMKSDKNKAKGVWLGEDGKGVKDFDKFWKSLLQD